MAKETTSKKVEKYICHCGKSYQNRQHLNRHKLMLTIYCTCFISKIITKGFRSFQRLLNQRNNAVLLVKWPMYLRNVMKCELVNFHFINRGRTFRNELGCPYLVKKTFLFLNNASECNTVVWMKVKKYSFWKNYHFLYGEFQFPQLLYQWFFFLCCQNILNKKSFFVSS